MEIGIVSVYPSPGSKHTGLSGVASYTKNLAVSLSDHGSVTVFADRKPNVKDEYWEGVAVVRCWNRGVLYPFQIFRKLLQMKLDVVHVHHETFLYGGIGSAIVFPLLLFFTRLMRKPVVVTLHGVIPLPSVSGRFLVENWIRGNSFAVRFGLILSLKIIAFLSTSIIVHEEKFKEVLEDQYKYPAHKIHVCHHGIEERNDLMEREEAKERLGLCGKNVILFFGYITGYKNIELLIESASFLKTGNWVMVIAGGSHPRLSTDPNYRNYLSDLRDKALTVSKERVLFRGFVAEEEIPLYFSATDLVVLPYKTAMSSSGPLSLAISYRRPFLISNTFKKIVNIEELTFDNDPLDLAAKINSFFEDKKIGSKALKYSKRLGTERSWSNIGNQTSNLYQELLTCRGRAPPAERYA